MGKIPWRRARQSTPVPLSGESHGQRSLEGYRPGGQKELDTTVQPSMLACVHLQLSLSVNVLCMDELILPLFYSFLFLLFALAIFLLIVLTSDTELYDLISNKGLALYLGLKKKSSQD